MRRRRRGPTSTRVAKVIASGCIVTSKVAVGAGTGPGLGLPRESFAGSRHVGPEYGRPHDGGAGVAGAALVAVQTGEYMEWATETVQAQGQAVLGSTRRLAPLASVVAHAVDVSIFNAATLQQAVSDAVRDRASLAARSGRTMPKPGLRTRRTRSVLAGAWGMQVAVVGSLRDQLRAYKGFLKDVNVSAWTRTVDGCAHTAEALGRLIEGAASTQLPSPASVLITEQVRSLAGGPPSPRHGWLPTSCDTVCVRARNLGWGACTCRS